MSNFTKSWKTTAIGIVAIAGLAFKAYTNGGFSVQDFLALAFGVGFLLAKDSDKTHSKISGPVDPDREAPDERG